jgi:hypothetical protein
MRLLIYSGLLYLIGISIILILRPKLMFADNGKWKEFGLGRNTNYYTWMPFWLFAIIWSILSYLLTLCIVSIFSSIGDDDKTVSVTLEDIQPENITKKSLQPVLDDSIKSIKKKSGPSDMKPGYYILNAQETMKTGIPKYIYLGPEAPNLIYNNSIESD